MNSRSSQTTEFPVAVVSGGSAGLGRSIAIALLDARYRVIIIGRDTQRLAALQRDIKQTHGTENVMTVAADVTVAEQVDRAFADVRDQMGRLDVLVNCVGKSDRGRAENLDAQRLHALIDANVLTALLCSQSALPMIRASQGVIVNIGSLASKVGARYLGGYPAAKHALAGLTQQMRLELKEEGVHVALVSPGPIRRPDAGSRYNDAVDTTLPSQASAPGGGTRLDGLDPDRVAQAVMRCIRRRQADTVLPAHLRALIAIGHAFPGLGDWLLLKFTSTKR